MDITKMEGSGIQGSINAICKECLLAGINKRRNIVLRQTFTQDQYKSMKRKCYETLFLNLHSPYLWPSKLTSQDRLPDRDGKGIYDHFAERVFWLRHSGHHTRASKLESLLVTLKTAGDEDTMASVLKFLFLMSSEMTSLAESEGCSYKKPDSTKLFPLMQFDDKVMHLNDSGFDNNVDDGRIGDEFTKIAQMSDKVFNLLPGSFFQGCASSFLKSDGHRSAYYRQAKETLFGGLTHSKSTSMEVTLRLPALPDDPTQQILAQPEKRIFSGMHSDDEGFEEQSISSSIHSSDVSLMTLADDHDHLAIWDASLSVDRRKCFSWEKFGSYGSRMDLPYLTEMGDEGFDHMYSMRLSEVEHVTGKAIDTYIVTEQHIFRDSLSVLLGVPSSLYTFYPMTCSFKPNTRVRCSGVSMESVFAVMDQFSQVGTHYRQLHKFTTHHADKPSGLSGGLILKAFLDALNDTLYSYRAAVFVTEERKSVSVMVLWQMFEKFGHQLKFLSDICFCSEAFKRAPRNAPKPKFPVGTQLLCYLYDLATQNASTEHYHLLLHFFSASSVPFVRFITDWLFDGVCHDPYSEFFIHVDPQYLCFRDKYFWTQGFQVKQTKETVPLFLEHLTEQIFSCGKAINLLKLVDIQHYLFDRSVKQPCIAVTLSTAKLLEMEKSCDDYISRVHDLEAKAQQLRAHKDLEKLEAWREDLRAEKMKAETVMARLNEMEREVRVAIRSKKQEQLKDLQSQYEAALQKRRKARDEKLAEDRKWLLEMEKYDAKEDESKRKAKEELIEFYAKLSAVAEKREAKALWMIRRFQLADKRKQFIREDADRVLKLWSDMPERNKEAAILDVAAEPMLSEALTQVTDVLGYDVDRADGVEVGSLLDLPAVASEAVDDAVVGITGRSAAAAGNTGTADGPDSPALEGKEPNASMERRSRDLSKFPSEQISSPAKSVLYPDEAAAGKSSYQDQFVASVYEAEIRQPAGSSAFEGTKAKALMYPVETETLPDAYSPTREREVEGAEAKGLLYPSEDAFLRADPDSASHNGQGAKTLLYSTSRPGVDDSQFRGTRGTYRPEGLEAKGILYPGQREDAGGNVNMMRIDKSGEVIFSERNDASLRSQTDGRRQMASAIAEGSQTKRLSRPSDNRVTNAGKIAVGELVQATTKDGELSLIPDEAHLQAGDVEVNDRLKLSQRPNQTGFDPKPSTAQHSSANNVVTPSVRTYGGEGAGTKSLLYPGASSSQEVPASRKFAAFEKESEAQTLLYPDKFDRAKELPHVVRDFEPKTRIKELLYPLAQQKAVQVEVARDLSPTEVWMDMTVEPFVDNYDVMNLEPQTHLFGRVGPMSSHHSSSSEEASVADAVDQLPLETIVKRSLMTPIRAQVALVNKAIMIYYLEDLKIEDHFNAFRKFLLLEDGEFGHSLCTQLFEKVSSGMAPRDFCNPLKLTNILVEALRLSLFASKSQYAPQLTFSLKWMPEVFQSSDIAVLDFLELRYRVPWPCNIIVTENTITKYNTVFTFLLRLKKAGWSLQKIWQNLKRAGHDKRAAMSPQIRQLQLFRHEMQHFVNNLERYTVDQIIHVSWQEFQQDLQHNVHSLDDLHRCHVTYLNKIIFRSLLSKNASPVYKLINDIFNMILSFHARLLASSWTEDRVTGYVEHPAFTKLKNVHTAFKHCASFLFSVISKLVRRGYQDHLDNLLLQVNFNSFYSTAVVN